MKEDCKENFSLNARRFSPSEKEVETKDRFSLSSDEDVFYKSRRSVLLAKDETKLKRKRDNCNNKLPLSERSSGRSKSPDKNGCVAEAIPPRRSRKKLQPLRERVIDLTEEVSDDSSEESPSTLPSSLTLPVPSKRVKKKSLDPKSVDCKYCGETEDKITKCSAPLEGASKEKDMLNFHEIQSSWKISDELPCVKLTNFRVYDKARHLCAFDGKFIKGRDGLYFSGFVRPDDSEKTDSTDSFPCENMGPITDWWFEGFDLDAETSLGFSSKMAHYYLETPMAEYAPFMVSVKEKIFLAKVVIDILENVSDDEELNYEDLLNSLKAKDPPESVPAITEEILLRNGVFVCEQVQASDAAAEESDKLMASMMCMEELSRKVGYDFNAKSDEDTDDDYDSDICQVGEIERAVIDFIDLDDIDSSEDDEDEGRRRRRVCRKYYADLNWAYEDDEKEVKRGRKRRRHRDDLDYIDEGDDAEEKGGRKLRLRKGHHRGPMRRRSPTRRIMMSTKTIKLSKATTTPLVENIFESFFSGEIMKNYTRDYSDADLNQILPNLCLPKLEDMGIDWEDYKIRFACEWSDEEKSQVSELEEMAEEENKSENEHVLKNEEKMEAEDARVSENEEEKPEHEQKAAKEEESELESEGKEEEMKTLSVCLPVVRKFDSIKLKAVSPDVHEFYDDKNKKRRKEVINLDSSDSESDSEHASKRKKMSANHENSDDAGYTVLEFRQMLNKKKTRRSDPTKIKWVDRPYKEVDGYEYHKQVQINDSTVSVGDFISTYKSNSIACVKYMFENVDEEQLFHLHWFTRSMDTILAEVGHPNEVYESNKCEDVSIEQFYQVVSVKFIPTGADWFETGNMPYVNQLNKNEDPSRCLYYQKRFCEKTARFTDAEPESPCSLFDCFNCERQRKLVQREIPYSEEKPKLDKEHKMFVLKTIRWRDEEYSVGTCVFLNPGSIMKLKSKKNEEDDDKEEDYDEDLYPEKYRKPNHFKSVQDEDVLSDPFEIGCISAIWSRKQITKSMDVKLKLKKFYRPHNTSLPDDEIRKLDLNILYCSDEECAVDFSKVQGKCYVSYKKNLTCSVDEWTQKGPYRFYFSRSYNSERDEFESPSPSAMKIGNLEKDDERDHVDLPKEYPPISRPLRSLDVFAGCGGLTEGLHQAKVAESFWAIEKDTAAAKAFKSNYPDAAVFTDDCNLLLNAVINRGEKVWAGKKLPQKGDVEMLCGGPPCQGFSGMNRFRRGEWSKFNNSLVVTFLSYCDYYRPRFFVMENVRNFVSHEKSVVLKLTLNCLVRMGYQVAFGVLQSGRFGIPQSRRRVIILAAAPGETLPLHPEATHTFALRGFESIMVDDSKYVTSAQWSVAAPYRMITVYDALSDLPPIKAGESQMQRPYCRKPITHFQRQLRTYNGEDKEETVLRDHVSKSLSALVVKRLSFIPKKLGCDWRDLPNIVVKLGDGTVTKKLEYTHHDAKQGRASNGALRGVCCCANNEKCRPEFRQSNTIIPWCLPHTSNRHGHWRGLYGRLGWDEYFRTVVTNPEPMGKQGRVVHPEEDRVISVKECARSQGFPDRFKFYGHILDKHRQIGNAVAPPLAKAIGLEIRKCIQEKESKVQHMTDSDAHPMAVKKIRF